MKRFKFSILFIILLLLESGCDNNDELANALLYGDRSLPSLTTKEITNITSSSATSGGIITSDGGDDVTICGIAYGESENPTINDNTVSIEEVTSDFIVNISGLLPETMYYVRAYATNNAGTSYGDNVSFTTLSVDPDLPTVTTNNVTHITTTSATGGGNISSIGGSPVTARGIAYGTSPNPTVAGNTIPSGSGTGSYTSQMTGLSPNTTYHVRAYATNSAGTAYGDNVTFTTQSTSANLPSVNTSNITNITSTSATGGGTVTSDGGASVTARGLAYGTSPNPTTAGSTVSSGSGTGNFTANMTGLTPNSTYYVRAYATNSAGTAYGSQHDFITLSDCPTTITDIDGNTYQTVLIGNQCWMQSNLVTSKFRNGQQIPNVTSNWHHLSSAAWCWYDNNENNNDPYGKLYNWYAVDDPRGICPPGWRVPGIEDWQQTIQYLGSSAGGKLKSTRTAPDPHPRWDSPNTGATNESGFTAFPGGQRWGSDGNFQYLGRNGIFWSSTETSNNANFGRSITLDYYVSGYYLLDRHKAFGFSIRCVKD